MNLFEQQSGRRRRRQRLSTNFWKVVVCGAFLLELQLAFVWFHSDLDEATNSRSNRIVVEHVSDRTYEYAVNREPIFPHLVVADDNMQPEHDQIFAIENGRNKSIAMLLEAGVRQKDIQAIQETTNIPAWSQILQNYGEEPVILGLERCQAYRETVQPKHRFVAPAGIFSTGTNLFHKLLTENCKPHVYVKKNRFVTWQVPWGKHNPEFARGRYSPAITAHHNQSAVLPVVTVRHPYSWLESICIKYYNLIWEHDPDKCPKELALHRNVTAEFGVAPDTVYDSVIHAWRDWNAGYFEQQSYPMLIVRHEDLVFRPKAVVSKVCDCVGGMMQKEFSYQTKTAKTGPGHGDDRIDLLQAWTKYGQPLRKYRKKFNSLDWDVIDSVLKQDHGMMDAFHYPR